MSLGFKPSRRTGVHYDLADLAVRRLRAVDLMLKGRSERHFEHTIVSHLSASPRIRKNLIPQIGEDEVEKIHPASLFGFRHRPDAAIGRDGTAIEIKVVDGGPSVRDILGQAIAYRMDYRFVILVLVDQTEGHRLVKLCGDRKSRECKLLTSLSSSFNVFSVIGPQSRGKNLVFRP